ncbi:Kelch repeat-containing protein 2 [Cercospora beticola]|uniref:Kelch repeat-containing protein 2 n=1 Tax=Cercospora beticola TaxID=122368 RepID=A0A2G5IC25_CERBT|nr:Kelch repeat-containing protein 2 [Cercospora beticola]PIB02033.1 Kelch repeat-containing protein 2 [Cercospora beticola]WPA97668.1 hypothetical protein RHO25_002279 [Cercospora beticola]
MSFLFKSSKKGGSGPVASSNAPSLHAVREHTPRDAGAPSQIPTLNGHQSNGAKPGSPTPPQSVNNSLNSISGFEKPSPQARPADERIQAPRDDGPRPEQKSLRERRETSQDAVGQRTPLQQTRPSQDASPYPWSQRRLNFTVTHANPFPRYGAAVNSSSSKDGSIYLMGGLINGSTVKGDLWMVECGAAGMGSMTCFPVATTSEGPGPRVGHASLLVGNAFIVFGGDTKMDEGDQLDDTLYLLNTSTKQWSRALPAGPRPPGRYGHTLNILGSKIYIFGGQVEGYFFNDLVAFDLNALQQATNKWEILIQNTIDGGPPHGQIPPARTNHTMITWQDRLYLFGGTDGIHWYNDVWSYSPHTNTWSQLDCIGYIPAAREGHAAALVGDVMYIFGGRNEEGNDLGDLAAFRISSRRWYTFQNMGPSPSPRSGHSMTTVGKSIVVLAGEPSSAPRDPVELGLAYFLDTAKIRYPPDATSGTPPSGRRPSGERAGSLSNIRGPGPGQRAELMDRERSGSAGENRIRSPDSGSRLPRPGQPPPSGPPPQAPGQVRQIGPPATTRQPTRPAERALSPTNESIRPQQRFDSVAAIAGSAAARNSPVPKDRSMPTSPTFERDQTTAPPQAEEQIRSKPETYTPSQELPGSFPQTPGLESRNESRTGSRSTSRQAQNRYEEPSRPSVDNEPLSRVRKISEEHERPQDSGLGSSPALTSQYEELARELELIKQKNAWYASELALARKSGYQARSTESPVFDESSKQTFNDDDKPLIEALLKMRGELAKMQETIEEQSNNAATRVAEIERQRDTAINEAVFAKARLAGSGGSQPDGETKQMDRDNDISRRLAASLEAQSELKRQIDTLIQGAEAERKARELAEDTANAAQKRVLELDQYRQQHASEVESLRSELHEAQKAHREAAASHTEILTQHKILEVDKNELRQKLESMTNQGSTQTEMLASLEKAVQASKEKADLLQQQLDDARGSRDELESSLRELKSQHDQRVGELESTSRRLREAEELAEKHAEEARTHREAVMSGLQQVTSRDVGANGVQDERVEILQKQVETAQAQVRQNQAAADAASEKLRRAEERIAGLESYQEQASREGLSIRKQLQVAMKENQALGSEKAELEQKLERHMLETNALSVQHASLKDILNERGISAADKRRSRGLDSPGSNRFSTPDTSRVREMEQQLEAQAKNHEDLKQQFEEVSGRSDKMKREYEEKLAALDNDHQAAVKYLRGTEKMLSKMKQEMQRVKNENADLSKKLTKAKEDMESSARSTPATERKNEDWEGERQKLKQEVSAVQTKLQGSIDDLESRITKMQEQLRTTEQELSQSKTSQSTAQTELENLRSTIESSKADMERLQKENALLEERARDAENKVQLLLDQVESSVDNYRRQSRMRSPGGTPTLNGVVHQRAPSVSESSVDAGELPEHLKSHSRQISTGGDSTYSASDSATGNEGRNSMALDSLASELDALRTHWETTNKNYRLSDRFDYDKTPTTAGPNTAGGNSSLMDWRRGLELDDDDDNATRPGTSDGSKKSKSPDAQRKPSVDEPTPTATPRLGVAGGML